jgi:NitT/TauT family transport system substrate-binding protein
MPSKGHPILAVTSRIRRGLFIAGAFCVGIGRAGAQTTALTTLRLASAPDDDVTPVLYAQQSGLFRSAGLDVDVRALSNGAAVAAAVAGGSVDVGKSSMISLISAHARGVPLSIVAPSAVFEGASARSSAMIVPKDSSVHTARDLEGKVVSCPALRDLLWVATRAWIDKNGGDSSQVQFVEAPMPMVASALDSGRIAAGTLADPTLSQAMGSGKYRVLGWVTEGLGNHIVYSAWFANRDFVAKNTAALRRFVAILRQASIYANSHHTETAELLAKFSGIDPATIAHMARTVYATSLDPRDFQPLIDAAARYKVIPTAFQARDLVAAL